MNQCTTTITASINNREMSVIKSIGSIATEASSSLALANTGSNSTTMPTSHDTPNAPTSPTIANASIVRESIRLPSTTTLFIKNIVAKTLVTQETTDKPSTTKKFISFSRSITNEIIDSITTDSALP